MRWYLVVIFAYVLAVMQTTLFAPDLLGLGAFGTAVRPDLLLLVAVFVALRAEPPAVFIAAWCLGLVEDLSFGHGPLGVTAMLFGLAASGVCLLRGLIVPVRILTQVLLALAAVVAVRVPQQMLLWWLTGSRADLLLALQRGCGDALYSAILAPYLFWLLAKLLPKPGTLSR